MTAPKCPLVRRVVLEEDAMSAASFDFRVDEILAYGNSRFGATRTVIRALDQGKIWLRNTTDEEKRDILASLGALEHLMINPKK